MAGGVEVLARACAIPGEHVARVSTTDAIITKVNSVATALEAMEVVDDESSAEVGERLRAAKTVANALEERRTQFKAPYLDAGRAIDSFFKGLADRLGSAEKTTKARLLAYRERVEAERRRVEAEARAEAERLARLAREAEEKARAEAERKAEEARAAEAAREWYEDPVEEPEAAEPETSPEPVVESVQPQALAAPMPETPKASGVSFRTVYKAEVVNMLALIKAAADGDSMALNLLVVDMKALNQFARQRGEKLSIPGVKVTASQEVAARAF